MREGFFRSSKGRDEGTEPRDEGFRKVPSSGSGSGFRSLKGRDEERDRDRGKALQSNNQLLITITSYQLPITNNNNSKHRNPELGTLHALVPDFLPCPMSTTNDHGFGTRAIHAGQSPDPSTGAIMTPIYQTSTYVQELPGKHKGYAYARGKNPTRVALEQCIASLENAKHGLCFSSGQGRGRCHHQVAATRR